MKRSNVQADEDATAATSRVVAEQCLNILAFKRGRLIRTRSIQACRTFNLEKYK